MEKLKHLAVLALIIGSQSLFGMTNEQIAGRLTNLNGVTHVLDRNIYYLLDDQENNNPYMALSPMCRASVYLNMIDTLENLRNTNFEGLQEIITFIQTTPDAEMPNNLWNLLGKSSEQARSQHLYHPLKHIIQNQNIDLTRPVDVEALFSDIKNAAEKS